MADRIFERILNQTAAGVEAQQEQADPELKRRKAQARRLPPLHLPAPRLPAPLSAAVSGSRRSTPPLLWPTPQANEEEQLRKLSSGMTAGDAIKRILLAAKDRDYFRQGALWRATGRQAACYRQWLTFRIPAAVTPNLLGLHLL